MKKITSLSLGFAFLIMSYTGIMLFIVPHGKVAYWSDWHLLGLSKGQYGDLHTTSMVMFLSFAILHIYYNWKPLISYMKDKSKKISFTKKEFLIALLINVIFVVGTLTMIPPFKTFLDFGGGIKDYWAKEYGEPPYGHAEETKLNVICRKLHINLEEAKSKLKQSGITFQENETLKHIARVNQTSPSAIFKLIKVNVKDDNGKEVPSSLGRRTLQDLSDMGKIDLKKAIATLKEKGLKDPDTGTKIKHLADELEMKPLALYKLIKL